MILFSIALQAESQEGCFNISNNKFRGRGNHLPKKRVYDDTNEKTVSHIKNPKMGEAELVQLLEGCRKQDRKDQKALYKAFYGFAMGICLRYAGNRYQASEVLNQGFLKVFMNLDKYSSDKPFKGWLGRIMINTSINYYRSNLKMSTMEDLDKAESVIHSEQPDSKLKYDDLLGMVHQLPQAYRTVFNLYAIEGYTHEEIGKLLGISDGTSKSNLFKAREKLKKMVMAAEEQAVRVTGRSSMNMEGISPGKVSFSFINNGVLK